MNFLISSINFSKRQHTIVLYGLLFSVMCSGISCNDSSDKMVIHERGIIMDHEGNAYRTIKIGEQWWMAENLKVTSFRSGEPIQNIETNEEWMQTNSPARTSYNNVQTNYGLLYNFYVLQSGSDIAPEGWHVPTDEDWKILEQYIGLPIGDLHLTNWRGDEEGDLLKAESTHTTGWISYEGVWGTDLYGFAASGGSCRVFNGEWGFPGMRHNGYWWTSSENNGYGWLRSLDYKKSGIFRFVAHPNYGFSIRCVKN